MLGIDNAYENKIQCDVPELRNGSASDWCEWCMQYGTHYKLSYLPCFETFGRNFLLVCAKVGCVPVISSWGDVRSQ